jgi:uncharacterized protein (DUF302 family)
MEKDQLILENPSRQGFEQTVSSIIAEAEKREWTLPAVHDLQQSLARSGKMVRPVKVIEICKPKYSGRMLELSDERIVSVMMPCRISVYEKEDGRVYVSMINSGLLAQGMAKNIRKVMAEASEETVEIVQSALG